jgi:MFS transporter, DHA2 family, multidrug resistance protein
MSPIIHPDGLPMPRRIWAAATVGLAISMAVMDSAIANVALPTIARDLHVDPALSIWVVNGYQLAITISLLPLSSLGDIIGYRRVYLGGLVLFTLASLACSLSFSLPTLAAARVLQGFGAAGIMSVNSALVRFIYPHRMLGRGIGINAVIVAVAAAIGPTIASAILSLANWPWLFAINVPLGVVAFLIGGRCLPHSPTSKRGFDIVSALLSAASFGTLIGSIDALGHGEAFPLFLGEMGLTAGLIVLLVRRQLGRSHPLLPVDLLRIPIFTMSVSTSVCAFAAQMLALVSLPFMLQNDFHFTAVQTGLLITPWPIAIGIVAPVAGRLADRYSAGILGGIGLFVFAGGLLSLAFLPPAPGIFDTAWRMVLCGMGFGLFQSPNNRAMLSAAPRERSGGASGMLGTARLLGQTTGAAIVALLFARLGANAPVVSEFIATGFAAMAAFVSLGRLYESPEARASEERNVIRTAEREAL